MEDPIDPRKFMRRVSKLGGDQQRVGKSTSLLINTTSVRLIDDIE
jgi:hypothetical protein